MKTKFETVQAEKNRVYDVYTLSNPDIDINRLGRFLPRIRKWLGSIAILDATPDQLDIAMEKAGLTGVGGDRLRGEGDKYY